MAFRRGRRRYGRGRRVFSRSRRGSRGPRRIGNRL